jgi:hypothetical protein
MSEGERRRWVVVGKNERSGELMSMTIESTSAERAGATARKHGILATSIQAAGIDYETPAEQTRPNWIICPNANCGYVGDGERRARGSATVLVLLLLIGIIPGIIYAIVFAGDAFYCPRCSAKAREE